MAFNDVSTSTITKKELLAEDGSIWITLDDNESHYMKVLCDEIFIRKNFVANVVWENLIVLKWTPNIFRQDMIIY